MNEILLITGLIIFFGSFNQGFSGFGFQLTVIPLLTLFMDLKEAVVLGALAGLVINIYLVIKLKNHISFGEIIPLISGAVVGIPIGIFILTYFSTEHLKPILGVFILGFVVFNFISSFELKSESKILPYVVGLIAGLIGGVFNTNGPPVIIYFMIKGFDKKKIKASITGYFIFSSIVLVSSHAITGLTTIPLLIRFVYLLPFVFGGIFFGNYLFQFVSSSLYKKIVLVFLAIVSITLFVS